MKTILFSVVITLILSGCGTTPPTQTAPNNSIYNQGPTDKGFGNPPVTVASGTKTVVL